MNFTLPTSDILKKKMANKRNVNSFCSLYKQIGKCVLSFVQNGMKDISSLAFIRIMAFDNNGGNSSELNVTQKSISLFGMPELKKNICYIVWLNEKY